jgi:hypothetical protein
VSFYLALKRLCLLFPVVTLSAHLAVFFGFLLRIERRLRIHCVSKTWDGVSNFAFAV